tara:strand:+ start:589 stop:864 length:276 start_codon:yes stop_codon:yes gene_type:complete
MPIVTAQYTLQTGVAQKIVALDRQYQTVLIHNGDHASSRTLYLGNSDVTTTTGMHLDPDTTITLPLDPGTELWAISAHDNVVVTKLAIKQD